MKEKQRHPIGNVQYIGLLDSGALRHSRPWRRGSIYASVCLLYIRCVTQRYGRCDIVFDGYKDEPSAKDATHLRRTGACTGVTVNFTGGIIVQSKKGRIWHSLKVMFCFSSKQRYSTVLGQ